MMKERGTYGDYVFIPIGLGECWRVYSPHYHLDILCTLLDQKEFSWSYLISHRSELYVWKDSPRGDLLNFQSHPATSSAVWTSSSSPPSLYQFLVVYSCAGKRHSHFRSLQRRGLSLHQDQLEHHLYPHLMLSRQMKQQPRGVSRVLSLSSH